MQGSLQTALGGRSALHRHVQLPILENVLPDTGLKRKFYKMVNVKNSKPQCQTKEQFTHLQDVCKKLWPGEIQLLIRHVPLPNQTV